ncbi:hypothetical protein SAMN05428984_2682 [Sphingomonas sp. OK281]|nr:hypothetical protein SAMN05428984_2682 [Sphingomonas sp. OK281]
MAPKVTEGEERATTVTPYLPLRLARASHLPLAGEDAIEGRLHPRVTPDYFRGPPCRVSTAGEYADRWMPERARHDGVGGRFRYNHFACLNFKYSAEQTTAITASTTKYPYCDFNSGMFSKFMP